ncbi:MAG: hypothetical protein KC438_06140 [Thermomicrobiales bacterium]|nr:hypothetical protein [Thermomicrobiales bacterium]MCO5220571.1 hypothetical protein [Thermomicrobiales bacterium]
MLGRTPIEAYSSFVEPIQEALNTITVGRLLLARESGGIRVDSPLNLSLNGGMPAPLRSAAPGSMFVEVNLRVRIAALDFERFRYQCFQIGYWYRFFDTDLDEIVAFHWTPDVSSPERHYPHLHVGHIVVRQSSAFQGRFHKLHIPTGRISAMHLVRLAIEEFGVNVRPGMDRAAVLADLNRTIGDA